MAWVAEWWARLLVGTDDDDEAEGPVAANEVDAELYQDSSAAILAALFAESHSRIPEDSQSQCRDQFS
jgi:hypothetical protein